MAKVFFIIGERQAAGKNVNNETSMAFPGICPTGRPSDKQIREREVVQE
jgi:hypothetical protein